MKSSFGDCVLRDGRGVSLGLIGSEEASAYRVYLRMLAEQSPWVGLLGHEVDSEEAYAQRFERLGGDGNLALGAYGDDGVLVGDVFCMTPTREKTAHVAMLGIGILEGWRGVGLGRVLMESAIEWARGDDQVLKIELGVFASNVAARRLYESLGFEVEGVSRRHIRQPDGVFHDEVLMGLWVG